MLIKSFGAPDAAENFVGYLNDLLQILDETSTGWIYWSYDKGGDFSILDSKGNEKGNLSPLIRTYPQKVAGWIQEFSYDPESRRFELTFRKKKNASGATEIFVPVSRVYGGSFQVTSTDPFGTWSHVFDPSRKVLSIYADPGSDSHTIVITPQ